MLERWAEKLFEREWLFMWVLFSKSSGSRVRQVLFLARIETT